MAELRTYPREKVMALCKDLGHDPALVSRIVIEPTLITVEHLHPITDLRQHGMFAPNDVIGVE